MLSYVMENMYERGSKMNRGVLFTRVDWGRDSNFLGISKFEEGSLFVQEGRS